MSATCSSKLCRRGFPEVLKSASGREKDCTRIHIAFSSTHFRLLTVIPPSPSLSSHSANQFAPRDVRLDAQHPKMDRLILGFHFRRQQPGPPNTSPREAITHSVLSTIISPLRVSGRVDRSRDKNRSPISNENNSKHIQATNKANKEHISSTVSRALASATSKLNNNGPTN